MQTPLPNAPKIDLGKFKVENVHVMLTREYDELSLVGDVIEVSVVYDATDVANPDRMDTFTIRSESTRVIGSVFRRDPGHVVKGAILRAVAHEIDEWLKVDGKRAVDPHPERAASNG